MITSRQLMVGDLPMLQSAMDRNEDHPGQDVSSYAEGHVKSLVFEDEEGPIGVLRYSKTLRLCTQWCDANDKSRNAAAIVQAIRDTIEKARDGGFTEIVFQTNSPKLAAFCKNLGFKESPGEYVLTVEPKEKVNV